MKTFLLILMLAVINNLFCQSLEPAQAYNLLDRQNNAEKYYIVSNYKVIGSPYLFGGNSKGNVYAIGENGMNIKLSYNVYFQNVEFDGDGGLKLIKELSNLDSFELKMDGNLIFENLLFINSKFLNSSENCFFNVISKGKKYSLYKKYSGSLDIVSTNYVQSNLRQFVVNVDYFYFDNLSGNLKKLKVNSRALIKEFSSNGAVPKFLETANLSGDGENALKSLFLLLNEN